MKTVFTTGEAAKICKVSQQTIIRCFDNGQLKGFRVPGSKFRRIPREALYKFMKDNGIPTDALESGKRKVLLVDDEPDLVATVNQALQEDGRFEVRIASNGFDAGMMVKEYRPDLIILDVMLPDINGREVCHRVRADPNMEDVRIICISGMVEDDKVQELKLAGADDFLPKPFATTRSYPVPGKAVGRAAVELPWLCPNTDSLIALADAPANVPGAAVADPALAIFILRFAQPAREPDPFGFGPGALDSPILPETAIAYLGATASGVLPSNSFVLNRVRTVATRAAEIASGLADATRLVPALAAATVVRLAPLGWYAVATVDPFDAADPLSDPRFPSQPAAVQGELWGMDHAAIARRLAARWQLPRWIATAIGNLNLPLRVVEGLVADRDLFAIAQLAILEAETEGVALGLTHGANRGELLDHLLLDSQAVDRIRSLPVEGQQLVGSGLDPNPHHVPLVRNLLRLAGQSRRRNGPGLVARLEEHIDSLHRVIAELGEQVGERLRDAKLTGLAELAAGAGHEINNPLAIISGNAQRLLRTEPDANRGESLHAIVRQANRIAGLLRDLMRFARPPKPEPRAFPMSELVRAVYDDLTGLAAEREVYLELASLPADVWLNGDQNQLQHALGAVVRNAVEAAPRDGWVRLSCLLSEDAAPMIAVEDSGPGLTPEAAEHAFDPFFCGRMAGRGRGLGLSTAWQLVRQNGGHLSFEQSADTPTRFLMTMRRALGYDLPTVRSA